MYKSAEVENRTDGTGERALVYPTRSISHTAMIQSIDRHINRGDWRRLTGSALGVVLLIAVVIYGRRAILAKAHAQVRLVVYAFSTQEEVLTQAAFPAFEQVWEAETERGLTIESLFGPSGTLARQIILGAPADVALFSNTQHVNWLKAGRRVWKATQPVVIGGTALVIVTRPGNPAAITKFADLAQPGLRLLHADPRSSGAGEWAVLAEYGSALFESGSQAAAKAQLKAIWRNVRLLGSSARMTMTLFELGAGDALVTYEQDARLALERGVALEIVVPPRTIVAHHVAVIVDDNVTSAERSVAQAFVNYLLSSAGQQVLSQHQLRPVGYEGDVFPRVAKPFTVEDLGGWPQAYATLVEAVWEKEIEPHLELEAAPLLLGAGE